MNFTNDKIIKDDIIICQPKANGFRFGCDSVLLAAFAKMNPKWSVADIGSGSGVIAALCAKMYNVQVTAIELQDTMYKCLVQTIALSALSEQVFPIQSDIKAYKPQKNFDAIICNPPYRTLKSGRISLTEAERIARFEYTMTIEDLLSFCKKYLKYGGKLFFSYDADMLINAVEKCRKFGIEPKRLQLLYPDIHSKAVIILIECVYGGAAELKIDKPLFQKGTDETTTEYRKIFQGNWAG